MPLSCEDAHHESSEWRRNREQAADEQGKLAEIAGVHTINLTARNQRR